MSYKLSFVPSGRQARFPEDPVKLMFGKHFRKDIGFFDLFNSHAASTFEGAQVLARLLDTYPESAEEMARLEQLEQECDSVTHQTVDLLHKTFITPLDRDEIVRLISRLDDIMDAVHFTGKRIHIFEIPYAPQYVKDMGQILLRSTARTKEVVSLIRGFNHTARMRRLASEIHALENEADSVLAAGMSQLFHESSHDPLAVIKIKEILESIEVAIDRCEDVANIIEGLYLEHS